MAALLLSGVQLSAGIAQADPEVPPGPEATEQSADAPPPPPEGLPQDLGPGPYNVTYRARVDGVSRGATIDYAMADDEVNTANPTMVPGRIFEATGVVSETQKAGMQVSIQWPYSANLHCEILVNDQVIAQADEFTNFPTGNTAPIDVPPAEGAPPADPNAPAEPAPVA
jgi:hypothetical protein